VPVAPDHPQNEPEYSRRTTGSTSPLGQEESLIASNLGPAIAGAGLSTRSSGTTTTGTTPASRRPSRQREFRRSTRSHAWHCYGRRPSGADHVNNAYPNRTRTSLSAPGASPPTRRTPSPTAWTGRPRTDHRATRTGPSRWSRGTRPQPQRAPEHELHDLHRRRHGGQQRGTASYKREY